MKLILIGHWLLLALNPYKENNYKELMWLASVVVGKRVLMDDDECFKLNFRSKKASMTTEEKKP